MTLIPDYENLTVVVGLGKTGQSVIDHLLIQPQPLAVWDTRPDQLLHAEAAASPDITFYAGPLPAGALNRAKQLIVSPGVALEAPAIAAAIRAGVPVQSDINLFTAQMPGVCVGVTGSNGKSTVVTLVGKMCQQAGIRSWVGGNIGTPVMTIYDQHQPFHKDDCAILELSSFQLERGEALPLKVAAILNISPDHLDRYPDYPSYVAAKRRIYQQCETVVANRHDEQTWPEPRFSGQCVTFGLDAPPTSNDVGLITQADGARYIAIGSKPLLALAALPLVGQHNVLNVLSALAIAKQLGCSDSALVSAITDFTGLPHRCQLVHAKHQIRWINDSKATNPGSCLAAIEGLSPMMTGRLILILGGQTKDADFRLLQPAIRAHVHHIVLLGKDTSTLFALFSDDVSCEPVQSMQAAVQAAAAKARPGDTVLLAPACASFDLFKNFEDRGERFIAAVHQHEGTHA